MSETTNIQIPKETVEVTVRLPREIVEFLQKWTTLVGETLEDFLKVAVAGEVHNMLKNEAVFDTPWSTTEQVIKTHTLEKYLNDKKRQQHHE